MWVQRILSKETKWKNFNYHGIIKCPCAWGGVLVVVLVWIFPQTQVIEVYWCWFDVPVAWIFQHKHTNTKLCMCAVTYAPS